MDEGSLRQAFDEFDQDASGRITMEELASTLEGYFSYSHDCARSIAKEIMRICDKTKDRRLNFDEFKEAVRRGMIDA